MEASKKQQIMEAAARLFRDRGYSATSMRDLAKAVHLQASSLYNHISSKQQILKEICFSNANKFISGIKRIQQEYDSPEQQIEALIRLHLQVTINDATSVTSFNDEWRHLDDTALQQFIELRKEYETLFKNIIKQGMREGVFTEMRASLVLHTILSSLMWVYDWYQPDRPQSIEEISDNIIQLLMNGLKK